MHLLVLINSFESLVQSDINCETLYANQVSINLSLNKIKCLLAEMNF
jgi:hypothetical protein